MEKLGIDPSVMIFQIINFGILVFMLNKFMYKPVMKAIAAKNAEREEIAKGREEIEKEKAAVKTKNEALLKATQLKKVEALREAQVAATHTKKEAQEKAEKMAKTLIEKAKKDIEAEKVKLARDFEHEVLAASLAISQKVIGAKADAKSVKEAYKKLGKVKSELWRSA